MEENFKTTASLIFMRRLYITLNRFISLLLQHIGNKHSCATSNAVECNTLQNNEKRKTNGTVNDDDQSVHILLRRFKYIKST